jgi:L-amino acid N-acyltransferase YncA
MNDVRALTYPRTIELSGGSSVTLRFLLPADHDALLAFARSLPQHDTLFLRIDITQPAAIDEWLDNVERGRTVTIIAEDAEGICGYGSLHFSNAEWSQHVGELRVIVGERMRGRGLGRRLTEAAFAIALDRGLEKMVAQMTVDQDGAIATFEHLGFKSEALLRDQVKDRQGQKHDLLVLSHDVANFQAQLAAYGVGATE